MRTTMLRSTMRRQSRRLAQRFIQGKQHQGEGTHQHQRMHYNQHCRHFGAASSLPSSLGHGNYSTEGSSSSFSCSRSTRRRSLQPQQWYSYSTTTPAFHSSSSAVADDTHGDPETTTSSSTLSAMETPTDQELPPAAIASSSLEPLSFDDLDSLVEQTRIAVQERRRDAAAELLETWLDRHEEWFENCIPNTTSTTTATTATTTTTTSNNTNSNTSSQYPPDLDQRVRAMLLACSSVYDLLPCLEPRLAPYNYLEPLFEANDDKANDDNAESSPQQLWDLARDVIQLSAESLQAYYHQRQVVAQVDTPNQHTNDTIAPLHLLRLSREIPQRTQALFERFQSALDHDNNNNNATIIKSNSNTQQELNDAMNHVLATWAYSQEHRRGTLAQAFYTAYPNPTDALRHKLLLRAWSLSRDKNFAFEATRHLHVLQELYRDQAERHVYRAAPKRPRPQRMQHDSNDDSLGERSEDDETAVMTTLPSSPTQTAQEKLDLIASNPQLVAMEPSLEDYHMVLKACTQDEASRSAGRAIGVVKGLVTLVNDGLTSVRPDVTCFRYMLESCALKPFQKPNFVAPALRDVWRDMEERWMAYPDYDCYAAAIRCWRHIAFHPENEATDAMRDAAVLQVAELLEDAKTLSQRRTLSDDMNPLSTTAYNDVLETLSLWSASAKRRTEAMEAILHEMETLDHVPNPNPKTYVHAVNMWKAVLPLAPSYHEPLARAKGILWRMIEHMEPAELLRKGNLRKRGVRTKHKNEAAMIEHNILHELNDPGYPVDVLNTYILLCSSTAQYLQNKEKEGVIVFREALSAVESFRRRKVQPNWATYSALLRCIKKLMPRGEERYKIVQQVFALACTDGMVEDEVLKTLMDVVSPDQYREMVSNQSVEVEGIRMVPEEWTHVALGGRVVSDDGRKTRPLSVSGELTVTMAMKEFKMRSLRDKRNQTLLRGGRWVEDNQNNNHTATISDIL